MFPANSFSRATVAASWSCSGKAGGGGLSIGGRAGCGACIVDRHAQTAQHAFSRELLCWDFLGWVVTGWELYLWTHCRSQSVMSADHIHLTSTVTQGTCLRDPEHMPPCQVSPRACASLPRSSMLPPIVALPPAQQQRRGSSLARHEKLACRAHHPPRPRTCEAWCCEHHGRGCVHPASPEPYDCQEDLSSGWADRWPEEKQASRSRRATWSQNRPTEMGGGLVGICGVCQVFRSTLRLCA